MKWVKSVWEFIVKWSSKLWEGIKKLPGWGVVALLMAFALVVYLIKKNALLKRRSEVMEDLKNIEIEHNEVVTTAGVEHEAEVRALKDKKLVAMDELAEVEAEITKASEEGPVGLAQAWKEHLAGGK